MDDPHTTPRLRRRLTALLASVALGLPLVACDGGEAGGIFTPTRGGTPTVEATASATEPVESPSPTPEASTTQEPPEESLRGLLLSVLSTGETSTDQAALSQMEVVVTELEVPDRDLWAAVSSGPGIWELDSEANHVTAVYERLADGSWAEVAVMPLASEPTLADIEVIDAPSEEGTVWLAVHGNTGAHSGTFELVRFDGVSLTSSLWWFSPSPAAATIADLDDDGFEEIVLDATDPYVYCYACNVRAWGELIYRWQDGEPVAVNIAPVETASDQVRDLTARAAAYVEADLWRHARATMQLATEAAPDNLDVWWLALTINRTAEARLADAGLEQQPVTTAVLAGEYALAVQFMSEHEPADVFDPQGPLVADTVAEGWQESMGAYLVDYSTRALEVEPTLAAGYAVRSLGRILLDADNWAEALLDMDAALAIEPGNAFYQAADAFLLARNGGTRG